MHCRGQPAQRGAAVRHDEERHAPFEPGPGRMAVSLNDEDARAGRDGVVEEIVAIVSRAGDGGEGHAGPDLARIVGQIADLGDFADRA